MTARLATELTMGDAVNSPLIENHEFIADLARYAEGLLSEQQVKKKYYFDDATWERLGEDDALVEAIEAEKTRRIRNGSTKRERARQLVVRAPDVLGDIMLDASASPKHRIDASKTLDAFAANGPEAAPASERFVITINLGGDVERYSKSIKVDPNDIDPNDSSDTPQELLPVIAANKRKDDGGGESI
jgi:hypothetical protein